jgi:hypothetical protein
LRIEYLFGIITVESHDEPELERAEATTEGNVPVPVVGDVALKKEDIYFKVGALESRSTTYIQYFRIKHRHF